MRIYWPPYKYIGSKLRKSETDKYEAGRQKKKQHRLGFHMGTSARLLNNLEKKKTEVNRNPFRFQRFYMLVDLIVTYHCA